MNQIVPAQRESSESGSHGGGGERKKIRFKSMLVVEQIGFGGVYSHRGQPSWACFTQTIKGKVGSHCRSL